MQLKLIVRTVDDIVIVDCSGRLVFGEESADLRDVRVALDVVNEFVQMLAREV